MFYYFIPKARKKKKGLLSSAPRRVDTKAPALSVVSLQNCRVDEAEKEKRCVEQVWSEAAVR